MLFNVLLNCLASAIHSVVVVSLGGNLQRISNPILGGKSRKKSFQMLTAVFFWRICEELL